MLHKNVSTSFLNQVKNYRNEKWKVLKFDKDICEKEVFLISNYGRVINCKNPKKNFLTKESKTCGYRSLSTKKISGTNTGRYVHRLVAENFIENKNKGVCVIHLDYDKCNNHVSNLRWATKREKEIHQHSNPEYRELMVKLKQGSPSNSKLTSTEVIRLKKRINDPKRNSTLKQLAHSFGISYMQLWRINSGENWGHIKI